jgi:hypothetical protein
MPDKVNFSAELTVTKSYRLQGTVATGAWLAGRLVRVVN